MNTFTQRKQRARVHRREIAAHRQFLADVRGYVAAEVLGAEFRLRGFFPSHPKVWAMIDERLEGEYARLTKLRDDCTRLLDALATASDAAISRGDVVPRESMNKAVA